MRTTLFLTLSGLLALSPAYAQPIPSSRSGIVLFVPPGDRIRIEEAEYTALKPIGYAEPFEIRIRPPFDSLGTAGEAVEMHARWLATAFVVQPASLSSTVRHPAGFDVAMRSFWLRMPDGRVMPLIVGVFKGGTKAAVVEFVGVNLQSTQAMRQIEAFIDGCRLAHTEVVAAGNPALTRYDLEEATDLLQWLIDVLFTVTQRQVVQFHVLDGWKQNDPITKLRVSQLMEFRNQLVQLAPEAQNMVRAQGQPGLIAGLRTQSDRLSTLLVGYYNSAHPAAPPAPAASQAAVVADANEMMARSAQSNNMAISMSNSMYNATLSQMAAFGNMSGTRYTVK